MNEREERVLSCMEEHRDDMIGFLRKLVKIECVPRQTSRVGSRDMLEIHIGIGPQLHVAPLHEDGLYQHSWATLSRQVPPPSHPEVLGEVDLASLPQSQGVQWDFVSVLDNGFGVAAGQWDTQVTSNGKG